MLVWYIVATALFRCPSSFTDLTEESPRVCKPYLTARSQIAPYIEPYYNSYAAPHVDKVRPYIERFNREIYTPSFNYGKQTYDTYGAPKVEQIRGFGQEKWDKIVKPQLDTAQVQAKKQYESNLAPHVSKASAAAAPYYTSGRDGVTQIYSAHVLPALEASRPYVETSYAVGHRVFIDTGLPYVTTAWEYTAAFFDRTLWPKLRILYGENVEPQLVRIGERLGRYRDGKRIRAVLEEAASTTQVSSLSSSLSLVAASIAPDQLSSTTSSQTPSASPSLTAEQEAEQIREKIESDLRNWQEKFAKAADKGTEDLEERVREITERQIQSQVHGVGEALVIQLEETANLQTQKLKRDIQWLVQTFPEEYDDEDLGKASFSLSKFVRQAGLAVKEKAQALRSWKETFDQETQSLVSAASESTLEVIDNIRDLGLQEIGLRWAQMEGVTYKDWSKYHDVKKTFDEWRSKVEAVAQKHEGLQKAKEASEDVESRGMALAEETAKELARLKEVGAWKMEAGDMSDDFSTKYVPAEAANAAQKVMKKVSSASEQVVGTSQGTLESIMSQATEQASDAASSASSAVIGTEPGLAERATSKVAEAASEVSESASEAIIGTPQPLSESVISAVKDKANQAASDASGAVIGTPPPVHESIASQVSESAASAASVVSEAVSKSSAPVTDDISSLTSSVSSGASSVASKASKKVYGGAMAQKVSNEEKPILDDVISDEDDSTYSETMQKMVDQAGDRYTDITNAVSEALLKATSTQGTVESASSVANEQYSKALEAASSVLYGTQQGTVESVTSVASEKYAQAVAA